MPTISQPKRTMRDRSFVKNAVLDVLSDGKAYTPTDIVRAVPGSRMQSLHVTLRRMYENGEVDVVSPGVYRIGTGSRRITAPNSAICAWIKAQAPGTEFDRFDVCAATGANSQASTWAIKECMARGHVIRVGRGSYRMAGGDPSIVPRLSLAGTIRRLMGSQDRPWLASEINAHVVADFPTHGPGPKERVRTLYQLYNMEKTGDVERIAPLTFRLLRREPVAPIVPPVPKGVAEIAWALSFGGLWLFGDLMNETGLTEKETHYALAYLEEQGRASNPYHLQWRLTDYPTDPVWDSRTISGAILGVFLRGGTWRGIDVRQEIQSKRYLTPMIHHLIDQGLIERVGHGSYRCPEEVRTRILARFAVRSAPPAVQPITQRTRIARPLSSLQTRLVDGMARHGRPMRKVEIAAMAGIGRGSAVRAVNALVEKGLLIEPVPGLYRVAA